MLQCDSWATIMIPGVSRTRHNDEDERGSPNFDWKPFYPDGAIQAKATDGTLASEMKLWAIMGRPCGEPFIAAGFLEAHPEFIWQKSFLRDMPGEKWSLFEKDMH